MPFLFADLTEWRKTPSRYTTVFVACGARRLLGRCVVTAAATPTAAQAARILSLEQQLQALRTEQDHYRRHYEELEGVC